MTKTKIFTAFGVQYRTTQFPALPALDMLGDVKSPMDLLSRTAVKIDGEWMALDSREAINKLVIDRAFVLPPVTVLRGITRLISDYSFSFAREWSGVKIPSRFKTAGEVKSSEHVSPMVSQIMQEGMATMRELEEYYSLEDAFKMFDVLVVKSVNSALSHEAASKGRR